MQDFWIHYAPNTRIHHINSLVTFIALLIAFAFLSTQSHAQTMQQDEQLFTKKFTALHEAVFTEGGFFSLSKTLEELEALEPVVKRIGLQSEQMAQFLYLKSVVLRRGGYDDEAWQPAEQSILLDETAGRLDATERTMRWYYASQSAENSGEYTAAKRLLNRAIQIIDTQPIKKSLYVQYIIKRRLGYLLHEEKKYTQAKNYNTALLKTVRDVQTKNPKLDFSREVMHLLNNLAQNSFELKEFDVAETHLQERLRIAKAGDTHQDDAELEELYGTEFYEIEIDSLFQLAVLMHEQNKEQQAEQYLREMKNLAIKHNDEYEIESAQERIEYWCEQVKNKGIQPALCKK